MEVFDLNCLTSALAKICRDHLLAEKWLIAPSLRTAHQWLDTVTRSGQPAVNVQCKTFKGLALDLAALHMAKSGLRLVSARGTTIVIDRILNSLKQQSPGYLTGSPITHSLSQSVYSSVNALRLAGIDTETLSLEAFELSDKGMEVVRILKEYLSELARLGLLDYAFALDLAVEALAEIPSPLAAGALILTPEDLDFAAKEKRLLEALPPDRVIRLPVDQPSVLPTSTHSTAADMLRWVLQPADAPDNPVQDDTVSIFRAVGEINEVREVFRRCLDRDFPLDEVEILHTDTDIYVPLVLETAIRLVPDFSDWDDLFVTFEEGIPATYSGPGKALQAWISFIQGDFRQSDLVKMIQEALGPIPESVGRASESVELARELKLAPIFSGRSRYLKLLDETIRALERQAQSQRPGLEDDDSEQYGSSASLMSRLKTAQRLRQFIRMVLETAPLLDADPSEDTTECG